MAMKGYPPSTEVSEVGRSSLPYWCRAHDLGWRQPWAYKAGLWPRIYRTCLGVPVWRLSGPHAVAEGLHNMAGRAAMAAQERRMTANGMDRPCF
jgi:hypothetical protein